MYKELLEQIKNSDMILIGIGKEAALNKNIDLMESHTRKEWNDIFSNTDENEKNNLISFYNVLEGLIADKNYFIITTNVDGLIYESRLNPVRITAPCGNKNKLQCKCAGIEGIIDAPADFYDMDVKLNCPKCHAEYEPNIYNKETYNEEGYLKQWNLYNKWLQGTLNKKLLVLEIGCDFSMLSIIRLPFEKIVMINQKAYYYRINGRFPQITAELKDRMQSFCDTPLDFIKKMNEVIK